MRVVLAGNSFGGVEALRAVMANKEVKDLLVLSPARGRHVWQPDLGRAARALGVRAVRAADVNSSGLLAQVSAFRPDHLFSVYFPQVFTRAFLRLFPGWRLNFHPSLLPAYRGVAPLIWAIIEGQTKAGVTVHVMEEKVDAGPIVLQRKLDIAPDDTGYGLQLKAAALVRRLMGEILGGIVANRLVPRAQRGPATYFGLSRPRVNRLDWRLSSADIRNRVRALAPPLAGCYSFAGRRRVVFEAVRILAARSRLQGLLPGTVFRSADGGLCVRTGDGAVRVVGARVGGREPTRSWIRSLTGRRLR